jgi:predicted phosphodiesterase
MTSLYSLSMAAFTFVHAADLHLDTPFEGIARTAPEIAAALRDASLEAWDRLVDLAIDRDAAFLLLAGDIYDGEERGVRAQLRLLRGLERLSEHDIQALVVHGNHDPLSGWSAIRHWPAGVTVFGHDAVGAVGIERHGHRLATVHGISFARRETTENLARRFRRGPEPGIHIGLLHCNVGSNVTHAPYAPCSLDDLRRAAMDYWALGHIHQHQCLLEDGPWVVYAGSLQGRSPKPGELGPKGAVVVEAADDRVTRVEHVPLDSVRFVADSIDITALDDLGALRGHLIERARTLRTVHGDRGLLVRTTLEGHGPVHTDLAAPGAVEALTAELRELFAGDAPFLFWERLRDTTRPALDRDALRERDDFAGELLRFADALRTDPARLRALAARHLEAVDATRLPDGINSITTMPAAALAELLDVATDQALTLVAGEPDAESTAGESADEASAETTAATASKTTAEATTKATTEATAKTTDEARDAAGRTTRSTVSGPGAGDTDDTDNDDTDDGEVGAS